MYQKLFLKVARNQTACNETLATQEKENLGQISFTEKADQNMLTNPLISKMFKTTGRAHSLSDISGDGGVGV